MMPVQEPSIVTTSKWGLLAAGCLRVSLWGPLACIRLPHDSEARDVGFPSAQALEFWRATFPFNYSDVMGKGKSANPADAYSE